MDFKFPFEALYGQLTGFGPESTHFIPSLSLLWDSGKQRLSRKADLNKCKYLPHLKHAVLSERRGF